MSFKQIFNQEPEIKASANARVNIIGEHTDYTGGYVMPTLLNFNTEIELSSNNEKNYHIYSKHYEEKKIFNDFIKSNDNNWADYIKGCLFVFHNENKKIPITYLNILISSSIPMERGISSSSALCVAILKALNIYFKTQYSEKHIAVLAQKVERNYIGVSGGIMDQMVSSIGIHQKAFFLDCLNLKYELIDIPINWKFCLVDSDVQRNLRDSAYNERYEQLKKAEKEMNIQYLGSVRLNNFNKNELSNPLIAKRAKHVITENERVLKAKELLIQNNINEFGKLMNESHLSYSKDFDASTEDVDKITKRSIESGAVGSRLTGGGFGGFTVSLIEKNKFDQWLNKMIKHYNKKNIFEV